MAKTFTFRLTSEGIKELERDLNALGSNGQRIFDNLKQAAPGFADGLKKAETQIGKTRGRLTELAKETSTTGKAFGAAGAEMERFAGSFADRLGPVGGVLRAIGPAGLIAAAGIGALTAAFVKSIHAAEEAERAQRKLDSVLRATGNSAGLTGKQIADFAAQMQGQTLFGGAQIKEASARLATFRSISGDTFKRVIRDAADLATVFDMDLSGAVLKLGKALDDPIAGYDDLAKSGVRLSNAQRDLITNFIKAGELARAQGVILSEVEKRVGGAAGDDQSGLTGSLNRLGDAWGTFWEIAGDKAKASGLEEFLNARIAQFERLNGYLKGPTVEEYIGQLQTKLAAAESNLSDKKKDYSEDTVYGAFFGDSVVAQAQANVDALKSEIDAWKTRAQWMRVATKAAEDAAEAAAKRAKEELAAELKAKLLADELERQAAARETASKNFDDFLIKLKTELDTLGMSNIEREKYNANLEVEKAVKDQLHSVDAARIDQARELIRLNAESAEQWEETLSFMDAMAKQQKKDDDFAKSLAKGQSDVLKEQQRQAEQQAETLQRPFDNAADNIQRTFADVFTDVYKNGIDGFSSLADSAITIFTRLAGELTALLIFQPQLLGGGAAQAPGGANGVGVTGANGSGSLTGGFNPSSLLSPKTFSAGQWNTGFGDLLFGSAGSTLGAIGKGGAGVSSQIAPGTASAGLFGSSGGGQFGSMLNSPLGGGALAGVLAGVTTYAAGGSPGESIGAGVGGAIGGIAGSYFGPIGSMVGSTIGSMLGKLVGGLFGKKEKYKKVKAVSGANLGFDDNGLLDVDGTFAKSKGKGLKVDGSTGGKLGDLFSDAFNDFFLGIGAEFDPATTAQVSQVYQARVKGKKKKGEKNYFTGSFADEYIGTANTAEELLPMFLSGSLAIAVEKGLVTGVSDTLKTIFTNVFKDNGRTGVSDPDELTRMVEFGKFYDRVDQIRTPSQAAAEALKELEKNLRTARSTAAEFGLAIEHVDEVFRQNFNDAVDSELLALKDPEAYALGEMEKEYQARLAVASRLGADITDVEELYMLKRQAIVEQGLSSVGQSFRDFFDSLIYGQESAIAPEVQLSTAKATYDKAVASGDKGAFQAAAQQYLSLMRDLYASTAPYVAAFQDVLKNTVNMGGLTDPKTAGSLLSSYGREGDSLVAHINPEEAALLKSLGGAGSINPTTGLLEFKYGADTKEGGATGKGKDGKGGTGGKGGGDKKSSPPNNGNNPGNPNTGMAGGPNYSGPSGKGTGVDSSNPSNNAGGGGGGWDKDFGPAPTSPKSPDGFYDGSKVNTANGPVDVDKFMHDWADYQGIGYGDLEADTFWDKFWNGVGGLLGFQEKNPVTDPNYGAPGGSPPGAGAKWGWDPAGLIGSILGGALGMPFGGGLLAGIVSDLLGRPLEMNMDASVFGGSSIDVAASSALADTGIEAGTGLDPTGPIAGNGVGNTVDRLERLTAQQMTGTRDLFKTGSDNAKLANVMRSVQGEISALRRESRASLASLTAATEANNTYLRYSRGSSK